jgi:hypothetical protein
MDGLQRPLDDHNRGAYQFTTATGTTNVGSIGFLGLRALGGVSGLVFNAPVQPNLNPVFNPPVSRAGGYRTRELEWRKNNSDALRSFAGQWVALEGEEIISHGPDPVAVAADARARGISTPYIFYVEFLAKDVIRIGI